MIRLQIAILARHSLWWRPPMARARVLRYAGGRPGAFGVIPAHLNELSPDAVRSLFPGFVYQLGVLVAAPAVSFEYVLRDHLGYPWALTLFELSVILSLILIFALGPEKRGKSFYSAQERID